jgi:tRNA pseudouridine38-40 synthase
MQNFKLTIAYDGTNYHGWQMQANARTVQGELTRVLSRLDHRDVTLHGAGRTDAGVHAEGQIATVLLERDIDPLTLVSALNASIDRDLRVMRAELAAPGFNARFSARSKTYRYEISTATVMDPFRCRYLYHYRGELDASEMAQAAAALIGRHDFSAFTVANRDATDPVRTVSRLDVDRDAESIVIIAAADGFLRYMVRTVVGTLIDVGRGRRSASSLAASLASRRRATAGPTAPACGLTLVQVDY